MQDRAEIIWNTYAKLRSDVLMSDRCSSVCNGTLLAFVSSLAAGAPVFQDDPDTGRYLGDEALIHADRAMERVVTALV
jgi:hypothetical protein